jgi:acetyl esterase/lipase
MPLTSDYPTTLVMTAEYCPLRDEGRVYVERLQAAGIPAELVDFPGMVHAFVNLEDLAAEACADLYQRIGAFLHQPSLAGRQ